jgi:hypothetical protein
MVTTRFDRENRILFTTFQDKVSLKEIINYIQATKDNISYPRNLKILTDSTDATMSFGPTDLMKIVFENEQSLKNYESITDAIVVDSPKVAALSVLYGDFAKNEKYTFKVFSTIESAKTWLFSV